MDLFEKEYDGVPYNAPSQAEWEQRVEDIKNNVDGLGDRHFRIKSGIEAGLSMAEIIEMENSRPLSTTDGPGFYRGFVAGLTNDDALGVEYLFKRRFPTLHATGGEAEDYYFYRKDDDGDTVLSYMDPETKTIKNEFADVGPLNADQYFGWIGPAVSFVSEGVGATLGMTKGALQGAPLGPFAQVPLAMAGGSGGAGAGRTFGDGVRAGVSALLDGPALSRDQFAEDATAAALTGLVPIGAGIMSPVRNAIKVVNAKFTGPEGKTALKTLLEEGGQDVDRIIATAKEKFDIQLTRAEAQGIKTNAGQIQRYLSQQPTAQRLFDFYNDRVLRMEDALDTFFDEVKSAKYLGGFAKSKMSGMEPLDESAALLDLEDAYENALKKLLDERKQRATQLYKEAFNAAEEADLRIDLSDIIKEIDFGINDPQLGDSRRAVLRRIRKIISVPDESKVDFTGTGVKDSLRGLDQAMEDLSALYEEFSPGGSRRNKVLAAKVADIKSRIAQRMESASPQYAEAKRTWSTDTSHLQLFERGFLGGLAKAIATSNDSRVASLVEGMFKGTVEPDKIRLLKDLIQEEDPRVWQNLKANWLRTQLGKAVQDTVSPFGVPNKFLSLVGIKNPRRAFGRGATKQRTKNIKAYQAILEPAEFENFKDLLEISQAISYIATQAPSQTQPLIALSDYITREANPGGVVGGALRALVEIPQRFVIRGFDDIAARQATTQKEAYEDVLITALIDGESAAGLADALRAINPYVQFFVNAAARGVDDFTNFDISDLEPAPTDAASPQEIDSATANRALRERLEEIRALEEEDQRRFRPRTRQRGNPQTMLEGLNIPDVGGDVNLFEPLPGTDTAPLTAGFDPSQSAIVLPRADDRELAVRLRGPLGGIASLAG